MKSINRLIRTLDKLYTLMKRRPRKSTRKCSVPSWLTPGERVLSVEQSRAFLNVDARNPDAITAFNPYPGKSGR